MRLSRDEVAVWLASLELDSQRLGKLERALSADEIARAARFYFERDRQRFVARRGILRAILASYLETDPSALRLKYNEFGKPSLDGSREARALSFNLSHSGALALIAVAIGRDVGVDLELIDSSVSSDDAARRFFAASEIATLEALPPSSRLAGFFKIWARKEAYVKALATGLSMRLDSFDVSSTDNEQVVVIETVSRSGKSSWKINDLSIDRRYAAAVAASGSDWTITQKKWLPTVG